MHGKIEKIIQTAEELQDEESQKSFDLYKEAIELIKNIHENTPEEGILFDFTDSFIAEVERLIELDRNEESYIIVKSLLDIETEVYDDFEDLIDSDVFSEWLGKQPLLFNQEEITLLEKENRIFNAIPMTVIPDDADKSNTYSVECISEIDANEKFKFCNMGKTNNILVFHGDVYVKDTINQSWLVEKAKKYGKENIVGVIFNGNLYVEGNIVDDILFLQVENDLFVDFIHSEDGIIKVKGSAYVKYGIYGHYNDGYIDIEGKLYTPFLIAYDHAMPRSCHQESIYIDGGADSDKIRIWIGKENDFNNEEADGWGWTYFNGSYRFIKPIVWDEEYLFDVSGFFGLIADRINPFVELEEDKQALNH